LSASGINASVRADDNLVAPIDLVDTGREMDPAVAAIGSIAAVPALLKLICDMTSMRFAAVARIQGMEVTDCAVRDGLNFSVCTGSPLAFLAPMALRSHGLRDAVAIEQASRDPLVAAQLETPIGPMESFLSVPIILKSGRYFGALCAIDPNPAPIAEERIIILFEDVAALIASQLDAQALRDREYAAWIDERTMGEKREQFIAILGHELRSPLQAVYASGDLLERRLTDPALLPIAVRIKTNVHRMSALVDDLLDLARARLGGGIGLELADSAHIQNGLTTVVQELQDAQPDCKILSSIQVDRMVRCDLGRLQQVASNLLANALTHGLPKSPVRIAARVEEPEFVLEVWNAGEPIPTESLSKVFEPFWRHSASASRNGLGLGLHICSEIVRAHQGKISVTSTREHGTQFTARFPLGLEQSPMANATPALIPWQSSGARSDPSRATFP
jgi:signal transduction histidine kinase